MTKLRALLASLAILPLAACFDADIAISVPTSENATAKVVLTADAEVYQMAAASGEDPCEGGELSTLDDGRMQCTQEVSGPIDDVKNSPDIGNALTIERRAGGMIFASLDRKSALSDLDMEAELGDPQMLAMMTQAFAGHGATLTISAGRIVESNGTIAPDGKSVSFSVPFTTILTDPDALPERFEVLLQPGL